jgi:hypothetical protein
VAWHRAYADPSSSLTARLQRVRFHLSRAVGQAPAEPVRLVSLCAGQGHDVVGVLPGHPRRDDVHAVLIEEVAFDALGTETLTGVGVHRLRRAAAAPLPAGPLFTFGTA